MRLSAIPKLAGVLIAAAALVGGSTMVTTAEPSREAAAARPAVQSTPAYPDYPREGQPNLYTRNPDRLSRFYQQLGFVEAYRFALPDGTVAFATLQKGPFYVTLTNLGMIQQSTTGLRWGTFTVFHQSDITVLVPDGTVDSTVARARAAGAHVLMPAKNQPWGERQAYVTDPDGNYVQISTHH